MNLTTEAVGPVTVVNLPMDTLDAANTHDFKAAMEPLLARGEPIVLDLSGVRFVDSSGCGPLLWCLRQVREGGGDMHLGGVSERLASLFKVIRLDRQVALFDNREAALEALR